MNVADAVGDEPEVPVGVVFAVGVVFPVGVVFAVGVVLPAGAGLVLELAFAERGGVGRALLVAGLEGDAEVPGENIAGCVDEGEPVHAATAVKTRTVNAAVPTAGAARNFMKPPCKAGGERQRFRR